jgi:hypothetical protein
MNNTCVKDWFLVEIFESIKRFLNNCESYEEFAKFIVLIAEGKSSQRIGFEDPFDCPF